VRICDCTELRLQLNLHKPETLLAFNPSFGAYFSLGSSGKIHKSMAQCKETAREFIQDVFSPMVAVLCSSDVETVCQKNGLSFVELIQPFCRLTSEGSWLKRVLIFVFLKLLRVFSLALEFASADVYSACSSEAGKHLPLTGCCERHRVRPTRLFIHYFKTIAT